MIHHDYSMRGFQLMPISPHCGQSCKVKCVLLPRCPWHSINTKTWARITHITSQLDAILSQLDAIAILSLKKCASCGSQRVSIFILLDMHLSQVMKMVPSLLI